MVKKATVAVVVLGLLVGFGNVMMAGNGCGISKNASCGSKAGSVQKASCEVKATAGCGACEKAGKACDHCAAKAMANAKAAGHAACAKADKSCSSCKDKTGAKAVSCADCVKAGKMCAGCAAKSDAGKMKAEQKNN